MISFLLRSFWKIETATRLARRPLMSLLPQEFPPLKSTFLNWVLYLQSSFQQRAIVIHYWFCIWAWASVQSSQALLWKPDENFLSSQATVHTENATQMCIKTFLEVIILIGVWAWITNLLRDTFTSSRSWALHLQGLCSHSIAEANKLPQVSDASSVFNMAC